MLCRINENGLLVKKHMTNEHKTMCAFNSKDYCAMQCAAFDIKTTEAGEPIATCSRMSVDTWLIGKIIRNVDVTAEAEIIENAE